MSLSILLSFRSAGLAVLDARQIGLRDQIDGPLSGPHDLRRQLAGSNHGRHSPSRHAEQFSDFRGRQIVRYIAHALNCTQAGTLRQCQAVAIIGP
jgi:hypothetical protein